MTELFEIILTHAANGGTLEDDGFVDELCEQFDVDAEQVADIYGWYLK